MGTLGGATFQAPYALPGSKPVNAVNTTTPVTSNTGSTLAQANGGFLGAGASGGWAPAPAVARPTAALDTGGGGGGGGTASGGGSAADGSGATYTAAPAPPPNYWSPQDEAAYQQGVQIANNNLNRIPTQLDIALANVGDQFTQKDNGLNGTRDAAQTSYNQDTTKNGQQFVTNKNTITDNASQGLMSLMRLLGLHGAGGSSTALMGAPEAVATLASRERSGAGQTFGQNQQALDTTWGQFQSDFNGKKQELHDWRIQQENQARISADTNKQKLLETLAQLSGQKAAAQGGSGPAAEQPYIDQINGINNEVDSLGRFSPTWSGVSPVYTAKPLSSYNVNSVAGPQVQGNGALADMTMPYFSLLTGPKKDQQQQSAI